MNYKDTLKSGQAQLGPYEALGRALATDSTTKAAFATKYGSGSDSDFITTNYITIFREAPTAGAAANLQSQITYFTGLYTAAGIPAADAALQARGAVFGQLTGYALTDPTFTTKATIDDQTVSFLTAAARGTATYNAPLPPVSNPGTAGTIISLTVGADTVAPNAADPAFQSTANNDTINGLNATWTTGDTIDAGAGFDTANLGVAGAVAPGKTAFVNLEKISFVSGGAASVDLTNATFGTTGDQQLDLTISDNAVCLCCVIAPSGADGLRHLCVGVL